MSSTAIQTVGFESEAGKLQADLRDVFRKMLSQTRRIDSSLTLGATTEALGQLRDLEGYLERGLEVLSIPLSEESQIPV
jgi:hypothetical protein